MKSGATSPFLYKSDVRIEAAMQAVGCWAAAIGLFVVFAVLMVIAAAMYGSLVREVNELLPADERIKAGDRTKTFYTFNRHAQRFPGNRRRRLCLALAAGGLVSFVTFCTTVLKCFASQR